MGQDPRQQAEQLQQCIKDCHETKNQLQQMAQKATDKKLKSTLNETVHHIDMCLHECHYAAEQAP